MNKYKSAIIEYDKKRRAVAYTDSKRKDLIYNCQNYTQHGDGSGSICLTRAHDERTRMIDDQNASFSDVLDYEEILNETGCDNCIEAFRIKHNELKAARREFGHAKARLTMLARYADDGE